MHGHLRGEPSANGSGPAGPASQRGARRTTVTVAAVAAALASGLTGCTGSAPSLHSTQSTVTRPTATASILLGGDGVRRPKFPAAVDDDLCRPLQVNPYGQDPGNGPLPAESMVTAARWCVTTLGLHGYQLHFRQSTGDVSALNRALHAPLTATASPGGECPAGPPQATIAVEVLDQHGQLFRPTLPTDYCGDPGAVRNALAKTPSFQLPTPSRLVATRKGSARAKPS